jgi:putative ABC transport system permease protein
VVFAIALGTAGLIVVITMGQDVRKSVNQDLELLGGATRIIVSFEHQKGNFKASRHEWFREETLSALRSLKGIRLMSIVGLKHREAVSPIGVRQFFLRLMGVDEYFWEVNGLSLMKGGLFGGEEIAGRERVCVIGRPLAKKLYGHTEVVGRLIPLDKDLYRITGVLDHAQVPSWQRTVFIPLTTAQDRMEHFGKPRNLYALCRSWDDVEGVAAQIPSLIESYQPTGGLKIDVNWAGLNRVMKIVWGIELFINLAVGATLVLGGFGIWNIMMNGVRARTREIGLKKAMGAEDGEILAQFLAESLCLSLGAALLGVGLGRAAVEMMATMLGASLPEALFFICVGFGLLFAVILGIGGGIAPAIRASRMEVVSAVRYE